MKVKVDTNTEELKNHYLEIQVKDYYFGIPVEFVRDVLSPHDIQPVALAPNIVLGSLNLRGRIVTAIDLRAVLDLGSTDDIASRMSVVVEFEEELYSFIIDNVADVMYLEEQDMKPNPGNLNEKWKYISKGIFSLNNKLLIILDVNKLLPKKSNE